MNTQKAIIILKEAVAFMTAGGVIIDKPFELVTGEASIDSNSLLYEKLIEKAIEINPILQYVDKELEQEAIVEFRSTADLAGLVQQAAITIRRFIRN